MADSSINTERVNTALEYMENRLGDAPSLDAVARAAHCSKYHFHRMFSRYTGMSMHAYLRRRRLTEGARRLACSKTSIIHIALSTGYESQQAFADAFAEMYKTPPGQYRKKGVFYPLQLPIRFKGGPLATLDSRWSVERSVPSDMPGWMELASLVVDGYPYFRESEFAASLHQHIRRGEALVLKDGETAIGGLLYSSAARHIGFLAVHPLYRGTNAARLLLARLLEAVPAKGGEIGISTFREGDRADARHRGELISLGFGQRELSIDHGYPTQKLALSRECVEKGGWNNG